MGDTKECNIGENKMKELLKNKIKVRKDCQIKADIDLPGDGWSHLTLEADNESITIIISELYENGLTHLVRVLCEMHPDFSKYAVGDYLSNYDDNSEGDEKQILYATKFKWNGEGIDTNVVIRKVEYLSETDDWVLDINIDMQGLQEQIFTKQVLYKDLCYALSAAYTKVFKEYGITGVHRRVWGLKNGLFDILFLKAIALDCIDIFTCIHSKNGETEALFAKEMELLACDCSLA